MKIQNINQSERISAVNPYSGTKTVDTNYRFKEKFEFSELPFNDFKRMDDELSISLKKVYLSLLQDILLDGCTIIGRGVLKKGDLYIEASFVPSLDAKQKPKMYLPIPGLVEPLVAVNHTLPAQRCRVLEQLAVIVEKLSNSVSVIDFIKLVVVTAHEYGHYISFMRNCHTKELRQALSMFYSQSVFYGKKAFFAYQIFSEELTAWRYAKDKLNRYNFTEFRSFDDIKYNSLQAYYKKLYLAKAPLEIYSRLALLDIDLARLHANT